MTAIEALGVRAAVDTEPGELAFLPEALPGHRDPLITMRTLHGMVEAARPARAAA